MAMLGNEGMGRGGKDFGAIQNGVQEDEFGVGKCEVDRMGRASMWGDQRGQLRVMEKSCVNLDWSPKPWPQLSPEALLELQEGRRLGQMTVVRRSRGSEQQPWLVTLPQSQHFPGLRSILWGVCNSDTRD